MASSQVASLPGGEVTINRTDPSRRTNEQLTDIPASRKGDIYFASQPTVHFSDSLSALGIILRYTSKPERGLFIL